MNAAILSQFISEFLSLIVVTAISTTLFGAIAGFFYSSKYATYRERFWKRLPAVSCVGCIAALFSKLMRKGIAHGQVVFFWQALNSNGWCYIVIMFIADLLIAFNFTKWLSSLKTPIKKNDPAPYIHSYAAKQSSTSSRKTDPKTKAIPNYNSLANKIFDISKDFMYEYGTILRSTKASSPGSLTYLRDTTNAGTSLYVYAMVKIRQQLKKNVTNKADFEEQDAKMIEVFAKKLMESPVSLMKKMDFTNNDMEGYLEMMKDIDSIQYIERVNKIIKEAF